MIKRNTYIDNCRSLTFFDVADVLDSRIYFLIILFAVHIECMIENDLFGILCFCFKISFHRADYFSL